MTGCKVLGHIALYSGQDWLAVLTSEQFQVFLTLLSKFFSSFPPGTCSLSVSRQYLALDGIYHLLRAPFSRYTTLWTYIIDVRVTRVAYGAITLCGAVFQRTYTREHKLIVCL